MWGSAQFRDAKSHVKRDQYAAEREIFLPAHATLRHLAFSKLPYPFSLSPGRPPRQ